jgi:hypothetical protein
VTTTTKDLATEPSLSEALRDVGTDLSLLVRQEIGLAKAELKQEAVQAAKGAGLLGVAGYAGLMALLMGSFAAAFALGTLWGLGWGALAVTGIWALVAVVLLVTGRSALRRVSPKPERTVESLKEDARWARHPIS